MQIIFGSSCRGGLGGIWSCWRFRVDVLGLGWTGLDTMIEFAVCKWRCMN